MDELLAQFLIEAPELAQEAGDALLALERDATARSALDRAFRAIHTLKGSVALFDLAPLGQALHAGEDVLGAVRAGRRALEGATVDLLVELVERTESCLADLERHGAVSPACEAACRACAMALKRWLDDSGGGAPAPDGAAATGEARPAWAERLLQHNRDLGSEADAPTLAIRYTPDADCFFRGEDPLALLRRTPGLGVVEMEPREPWPEPDAYDPFQCNLVFLALASATPAQAREALRLAADQVELVELRRTTSLSPVAAPAAEPAAHDLSTRPLRVDPARVDALMDQVGELIVVKNALAHLTPRLQGSEIVGEFLAQQQALDRLLGGLHRAVVEVRLTPLARIFERLPRVVRDLAGRLGKPVAFEMQGERVEADRSVVDGLYEPLLHILRNAIDHGLESEATRRAAGKPATGTIRLSAQRRGPQLVVAVSDDGRGVDADAVRRTAAARGLLSAEAAAALTDADAVELIFAPGFSTAQAVTEVSGRGVGMDSVRSAIDRLGGRINVETSPGAGATFCLTLPVSAVLTRVLAIEVGAEIYGVPLEAVVETVRLPRHRVSALGAGWAAVLRDRTLPVLRLADLLQPIAAATEIAPLGRGEEDLRLLVVRTADGLVGVAVDAFDQPMDVMLRPMAGLLSEAPGVIGASLLGDGRVLLVLDLPDLIG